jgi:ABC-type dipeptide/oligopeptide/nickel transport system permease subunit
MPTDLRERLQAAADANRRGIGHEIVDRLETSFTTPRQSDANTGELLTVIAVMAKTLADNWVAWHADADAHAVFRDAVAAVLAELAPDTTGAVKTRQAEVLFGGDGAGERLALMTLYRAS